MKQSFVLAGSMAALAAAPVGAQTINFQMNAQVAPVCGVYSPAGPVVDVNFGALANIDPAATVSVAAGDATYRCTIRSGFTRTITSQNNGWLTLGGNPTTDPRRRIRFDMAHGGGNGLAFDMRQLTAPESRNFPSNPVWLTGRTGSITFQTFGVRAAPIGNGVPGTTVFAGNYRDRVTITITAN